MTKIITSKLLAADAAPGVAMLLAYYAGGTNLFPQAVGDVRIYLVHANLEDNAIMTDTNMFGELIKQVAIAIDRRAGELTPGSLEQYLSLLRHGWRANRSAPFPAVKNEFRAHKEAIIIYPRKYQQDLSDGTFRLCPDWVRNLEPRPE